MFGTEAKPDNPPRNAQQQRKAIHQTHRPWWRRQLAGRKHLTQEIVLREELHPLCCAELGTSDAAARRAGTSIPTWPERKGPASRFAAATASWMARLMPTPPIGDIACAASPMHNRPGRYHSRKRLTFTQRSLISSQLCSSVTRSFSSGASSTMSARKACSPRCRTSSAPPFGMTKAHCQ